MQSGIVKNWERPRNVAQKPPRLDVLWDACAPFLYRTRSEMAHPPRAHTSPKRKRGKVFGPSLALRASVAAARVQYTNPCAIPWQPDCTAPYRRFAHRNIIFAEARSSRRASRQCASRLIPIPWRHGPSRPEARAEQGSRGVSGDVSPVRKMACAALTAIPRSCWNLREFALVFVNLR